MSDWWSPSNFDRIYRQLGNHGDQKPPIDRVNLNPAFASDARARNDTNKKKRDAALRRAVKNWKEMPAYVAVCDVNRGSNGLLDKLFGRDELPGELQELSARVYFYNGVAVISFEGEDGEVAKQRQFKFFERMHEHKGTVELFSLQHGVYQLGLYRIA